MKRNTILITAMLILGMLIAAPDVLSQDIGSRRKKSERRNKRPPVQQRHEVPESLKDVIVVYPEKMVFDTLDNAFDYCNKKASKGGGQKRGRIDLPAGTYVGNWIIPPGYSIYGWGPDQTKLVGATGVNQPTLKYPAPSGSSQMTYLSGLTVVGREVAALEYTGNNSESFLYIYWCKLRTLPANPIPAFKVSGSGLGSDQEMDFWTDDYCSIESATGNAVETNLGSFVELEFDDCELSAGIACFDLNSVAGAIDSDVDIYDCELEECQYGIRANNQKNMDIEDIWIEATVDAIELTNSWTYMYWCELEAPGYGVKALSGSTAYVGYSGLYGCAQPFFADGTSTEKHVFCHLDFTAIP